MTVPRIMFVSVALTACLGAGFLFGAPDEASPESDGAAALKKLAQRIDELEKRVEQLEKRQAVIALPSQTPIFRPKLQPGPQPPTSPPKGWLRREFNGMEYFIVPLDERGGGPQASPSPTPDR